MPTDAGTDTWTALFAANERLADAATVTVVEADSGIDVVVVEATLTNTSARLVRPVVNIFGPGRNPKVENLTTLESWQAVVVIPEGDLLVADMARRRVMLEGVPVPAVRGVDWLTLQPGANLLRASVSAPSPPFRVVVTWDAVAL